MAKETQTELVKRWTARLEIAKSRLKEQSQHWDRFDRYYDNTVNRDPVHEDTIHCNEVLPNAEMAIGAVFVRTPEWIISPEFPDYETGAAAMDASLNYAMQRIGVEPELESALLDAYMYGLGVVKTGWQSRYAEVGGERGEGRMEGEDTPTPDPTSWNNVDSARNDDRKDRPDVQPRWNIREERPFVVHVPARHFLIDPEALRITDARWVAHKILKPLQSVLKDPLYTNKSGLKASHVADHLPGDSETNPDLQRIVLWEIHDIENREIVTIAEGYDKPLRRDQNPLPVVMPFRILYWHDHPKRFYPVSDVATFEPQQREKNAIRSAQIWHVKRAKRIYTFDSSKFLDPKKSKMELECGPDGTVLEVHADGTKDAIGTVPDAPLGADIYAVEQRIQNDIDRAQGVPDFMRGAIMNVRTATEANYASGGMDVRYNRRRARVERWLAGIGADVGTLLQWAMPENDTYIPDVRNPVQEIERSRTGPAGEPIVESQPENAFIVVSKSRVSGEFHYNIRIGSALPPEVESQQWDNTYDRLVQNPAINTYNLTLEYMRNKRIPSPERFMNDPVQTRAMLAGQMGGEAQGGGQGGEIESGAGAGAQPTPEDMAAMMGDQ